MVASVDMTDRVGDALMLAVDDSRAFVYGLCLLQKLNNTKASEISTTTSKQMAKHNTFGSLTISLVRMRSYIRTLKGL